MISEDIPLEEGLMIMEEAIDKAKKIMQGCPETKFTCEEFQKYYDCVYSMSYSEPRFEKSRQLYNQLKRSLEESIETVINLERKGLYNDCDLLRNVVHTFVEFGTDGQTKYYQDFERAMLADSSAYYCQSASDLVLCDSMPDNVGKVYLFIMEERRRVSHYFHLGTIELLLQIVRNQLLELPANKFFGKMEAENSGITADYQEMLPKCASMTLEGGSSVSAEEIPFAHYRVNSF